MAREAPRACPPSDTGGREVAALPGPIGAPSALSMVVLTISVWWQQMLEDVGTASEVVLATLTYDHMALTSVLVRRLRGRAPFVATVLVDKESFEKGDAPRERARLRELRDAGAEVYLCRGSPPHGRLHMKALCVNRRTVYAGSANFTEKSSANLELVYKLVGPPVTQVREQFLDAQNSRGRLWDGA